MTRSASLRSSECFRLRFIFDTASSSTLTVSSWGTIPFGKNAAWFGNAFAWSYSFQVEKKARCHAFISQYASCCTLMWGVPMLQQSRFIQICLTHNSTTPPQLDSKTRNLSIRLCSMSYGSQLFYRTCHSRSNRKVVNASCHLMGDSHALPLKNFPEHHGAPARSLIVSACSFY